MRKTDALPMYRDFLKSQWDSPEKIRANQWSLLQSLLQHAYDNVPFYRDLFAEIGAEPGDIKSFDDFRRIPVLTKPIVQQNRERLQADNSEKFQPRAKASGGSTGRPLKFYLSRKAHSASWAFAYRAWHIGGWRPGDNVVFFAGSSLVPGGHALKKSFYMFMNNWKLYTAFEGGAEAYDRWIEELIPLRIPFIYGYTTTIYLFAQHVLKRGIKDLKFRAAFTTSEMLLPSYREAIEKAFSCRVFDTYGGTDGAGFAYECEQHDGMHLVTENSWMEVVDENDVSVPEGTEGRLISTDLYNYAMPFIRYDVGDLSSINSEPCACGRPSPRLMGIKGRVCDLVTTNTGDVVHHLYFAYLVMQFPWVNQFNVVQETIDEVDIFIKPVSEPVQENLDEIRSNLDKRFPTMKMNVHLTDTMPQTPGGKYKFVINKTLQ